MSLLIWQLKSSTPCSDQFKDTIQIDIEIRRVVSMTGSCDSVINIKHNINYVYILRKIFYQKVKYKGTKDRSLRKSSAILYVVRLIIVHLDTDFTSCQIRGNQLQELSSLPSIIAMSMDSKAFGRSKNSCLSIKIRNELHELSVDLSGRKSCWCLVNFIMNYKIFWRCIS